ncbi:hypothetical protein AMJ86_09850 [bacterium SM23_57]|nr:MAG: hypothetical protein AMJ86_09850 [bacterium SM23_57]
MMTFLNITLLTALVLGALPILIHLLNRQRYQRIHFPTLRFLQELQKHQMRRIRLRQIILLILRTLAILFAVFALARPVLKGPGLAARSGTASVILLDVSRSIAAVTPEGSVFRQAVAATARLANLMGEGDKAYLVGMASPPQMIIPEGTESRAYLEESAQELVSLPLGSNISDALDLAHAPLVESPEANREIYVISDFHGNCWDGKTPLRDKVPPDARVFLVPVGRDNISNRAVVRTQVQSRLLEPNRPIDVEVTLSNYAEESADNLFLSVYFDGRRVGQSSISLGPDETKSMQFPVIPERAGFLSGYAVLEDDDALLLDNRSYFTLTIPERIRVAMVGSDPVALKYISLALSPDADAGSTVEVREVPLSRWETMDLKDTDVLILADVPSLSTGASRKVRNFVATGGGLLILPGPRLEARNYNNGLLKELGLPSIGERVGSEDAERGALLWETTDWRHPLFAGVFRDDARPDPPKAYTTYQVFGGHNTVAVVTLSNGSPTLSEVALQRGRAFLMTTYPDPGWSDLWRHGLFAPMMHRMVNYLATARPGEQDEIYAGDPLVFLTDKASITEEVVLRRPSGETVQIIPKALPQLVELSYPVASELGVYRMEGDNGILQTFAVNLDPSESKLSRMELDLLRKSLGEERTQIIDVDHLEDQIMAARYGQELWPIFLLGSLGFLLAEMLVGRERKGETRNG